MNQRESTISIILGDLGDKLGLTLPPISDLDFRSYERRQVWITAVAAEIRKREGWSAYPAEWETISA